MTAQNGFTRRQLLRAAILAGGAIAVGGCSTAPSNASGGGPRAATGGGTAASGSASAGGGGGGNGKLKWWDQFQPLADLEKKTFAAFHSQGGPEVDYTVYNPNDQGKALQLAFGSKQLPDVFTLAGLSVPPALLMEQGWFSPFSNTDEMTAALPKGSVVEGMHLFDGKLYSFPQFSPRQYETIPWFNTEIIKKAGLDPANPPKSWDDFRAAARKVKASGSAGLLLPLKFADRMQAFLLELAQLAGFNGSRESGTNGIDLNTGEYRFHDDAFVQALDFLLSFKKDGTLFPASSSLDARAGRARWAAGASAYFFDGSYCTGVLAGNFKPFLDTLGVGPVPTPDGSTPVLTRPPNTGTYWIAQQSSMVDDASKLLKMFTGDDFQKGLAHQMDQPPLKIDVVASSDAHPTYKQAIDMFTKQVFLGPTPEARPGVSTVEGAMKPVSPGLGEIIQGAFSGQISDIKGALKKLSDGMTASREAAIKAKGDGKVTEKDWAFPDWKKGTDYSA